MYLRNIITAYHLKEGVVRLLAKLPHMRELPLPSNKGNEKAQESLALLKDILTPEL